MIRFFNLFLIVAISFTFLNECKHRRKNHSQIQTTSDRLKEFGFEVDGSIEIPIGPEPYYISYLLDAYRPSLDHAGEASTKNELAEILKNQDTFEKAFTSIHYNAYPVTLDGTKIDESKLQYWIAQQLMYTQNKLKKKGVSLTLKQIKDVKIKTKPDGSSFLVDYKILALGVIDLSGNNYVDIANIPIQEKESWLVPRNLFDFYFQTMGPGFTEFQKNMTQIIKSNRVEELLKSSKPTKLLTSTKDNSVKNKCFIPDGDHVSPYSYHYYYDETLEGCTTGQDTAKLTVSKVVKLETKITYPEYHRLFEDKKLDIFVYLGPVSGEEVYASNNLKSWLEGRGYQPTIDPNFKPSDIHLKYSKKVSNIEVNVEWSAGSSEEAVNAFTQSIKTHEIITYDGHAGYGSSISGFFEKEKSIPDNKYQIFILSGCQTYKYGMTQVLDVKAIHDFDFFNQNLDVITTYSLVSGHEQNKVPIHLMEEVIPQFASNIWTEGSIKTFAEKYSWLPIITYLNKVSDFSGKDNGMYLVSGEEFNDYSPGKTEFPGLKEMTQDDLLTLIRDNYRPENSRLTAMKAYFKLYLGVGVNHTVEETVNFAKSFCDKEKYNNSNSKILASVFYLPQCQMKKLSVTQNSLYKGVTYSYQKPIIFYPNGSVKQAYLASITKIGPYSAGNLSTTVFYENGNLRAFYSTEPFQDQSGKNIQPGSVVLYESGKLKQGCLKDKFNYKNMVFINSVKFHENGNLAEGVTETNISMSGIRPSKYMNLKFDVGGNLLKISGKGLISERDDLLLSGNPEDWWEITYFPSEKFHRVYSRGQKAFSFNETQYFSLSLREDGSIVAASYADQVKTERLPCTTGTSEDTVFFDKSGLIVGCKLSREFKIGDETFSAGSYLIYPSDRQVIDIHNQSALKQYLKEIGYEWEDYTDEDNDYFNGNW